MLIMVKVNRLEVLFANNFFSGSFFNNSWEINIKGLRYLCGIEFCSMNPSTEKKYLLILNLRGKLDRSSLLIPFMIDL